MEKNIYILDCTLRDGGYVNDWKFDNHTARGIIDLLIQSKVDIVECGILGENKTDTETTKFNSLEEIAAALNDLKPECLYTAMLNYAERDLFTFPNRAESVVGGIRLAFFKAEYVSAVEYANVLKGLGYQVFLQAMATYMYSEEELVDLVERVNEMKPFAFYLVDSFGTLFNEDIEEMFRVIDSNLDREIIFGFHAHNNLQMAVSNTIKFIELGKQRKISVDATVFGMGRGAGNAGTEIIMQYMNTKRGSDYDISKIIEIYDKYLREIYNELYWGYSAQCLLASQKNVNSAYLWYLNQKGITGLREINMILDMIPESSRYYLNVEEVKKAIAVCRKEGDHS